jgi:hypothetical protein
MAYIRPHPHRRRVRLALARARQQQTFIRQREDLAQRAIADLTWAGLTRIGADVTCRAQDPNYVLCRTLDDLANKQAEKSRDSLLKLGVWGGIALLAAILDN